MNQKIIFCVCCLLLFITIYYENGINVNNSNSHKFDNNVFSHSERVIKTNNNSNIVGTTSTNIMVKPIDTFETKITSTTTSAIVCSTTTTAKPTTTKSTVKSTTAKKTTTKPKTNETTIKAKTKNKYTDEELYILSHVIYGEASGQSREMKIGVGSVVLNRVKDKRYPNTIKEVVFQKGQYSCTWGGGYNKTPDESTIEVAKFLLENGSQYPSYVIFQSEFKQGDSTYKKIKNMYFCYYKKDAK